MKGRTMERWQFDEVNTVLDEAYRTGSGILRRRYEAGQEKMREAKSHELGRINHLRDIVSNIQRDIDNCRDKQRNARSSDFASMVQGGTEMKSTTRSAISKTQFESLRTSLGTLIASSTSTSLFTPAAGVQGWVKCPISCALSAR